MNLTFALLVLHESFKPVRGAPLRKKKKKSPFFHLIVPEDRQILMCLGNLFHCLNTLTANSVCLASHLIFPDLNYIH